MTLLFDGPTCLIRRVLIPHGHKRCSICLAIEPRATFGRHAAYCKACRRAIYHQRYSPTRQEIAA